MSDGLDGVYGGSLALLTDLYQLTMACGYWKAGHGEREAVFHLTFRRPPFGGGYAIAAGIGPALAYLERLRFTADDLAYLATLTDASGGRCSRRASSTTSRDLRFTCSVDVVPEGSARVRARAARPRRAGRSSRRSSSRRRCSTIVNFQTLIATKAARVVQAARGEPVLEFGLRRAQGIDGGLGASRAAYIGGCAATSNVLAGKLFGIPVKGTHAHSWVMFHGDELAAFRDVRRRRCPATARSSSTPTTRSRASATRSRSAASCARTATSSPASGSTPAISRTCRSRRASCSTRPAFPQRADRRVERSRREPHRQPPRAGRADRRLGRRHEARHRVRSAGARRRLQARRRARRRPAGATSSSCREQPIKISNPGVLQVRRLRKGGELVGDIIYDSEHGARRPTSSTTSRTRRSRRCRRASTRRPICSCPRSSTASASLAASRWRCPRARRRRSRRAVAAHPPLPEPAAVPGRASTSTSTIASSQLIAEAREQAKRERRELGRCMTEPLDLLDARATTTSARRSRAGVGLGARHDRAQDVPRRRALPPDRDRPRRSRRHPRRRHGRRRRRRSSSTTSRAASSRVGAYRLRLVIPFFGYSTMERAVQPGEVVTAKTRARLLSSIPMASRGTQVFLLDLHVDVDRALLRGRHPADPRLRQVADHRGGAPARRRRLRARLHRRRPREVGRVARERPRRRRRRSSTSAGSTATRPRSPACRARVAGKRVVIYDDMIRTGGSLINAARGLPQAGAAAIDAIATHGLFPGDSLAQDPRDRPVRPDRRRPTATRARVALAGDFLEVESTAQLLVEHLRSLTDEAHQGRRRVRQPDAARVGRELRAPARGDRARARRGRHAAVPARARDHRLRLRGRVLHATASRTPRSRSSTSSRR